MKHIVFDIKTIPQDEAKLLARAPEFTPPANLKDPAKIDAAIARKRADYLADAALNWKTAEVVLIGAGDDTQIESFTAGTEKEIIGNFLELLGEAMADGVAAGGHNVKGFDLPMLVNRARVHGLKIPMRVLSFWKGRPTCTSLWVEQCEFPDPPGLRCSPAAPLPLPIGGQADNPPDPVKALLS